MTRRDLPPSNPSTTMGAAASNERDAVGGDQEERRNMNMEDEEAEEGAGRAVTGYGAITGSPNEERELLLPDNLAADRAQASEGPLPVPLKSMFLAETMGTFLLVQLGTAANAVNLYILHSSGGEHADGYGGGSSHHSGKHHSSHKSSLYFNRSMSELNEEVASSNASIIMAVSSIPTTTALIWGGALAIAMLTSAALSGGHVNPSVSFSFALVRPAEFRLQSKLAAYWMAQVLGAALGAMVTLLLFHAAIASFEQDYHLERGFDASLMSAAAFNDYYSLHSTRLITNNIHAGCIEAFGAGVLSFALFVLTHPKIPIAGTVVPILLGLVYGMLVYSLGPLTGGSFNPARELGPRLVTWLVGGWGWRVSFQAVWPYIVGPLFGGPIGAFLADHFLLSIM